MTGNATITGTIGPAQTATAVVLRDVKEINYNLAAGTVTFIYSDALKVSIFELSNIATITMTVSGTTLTTTIST